MLHFIKTYSDEAVSADLEPPSSKIWIEKLAGTQVIFVSYLSNVDISDILI